MQIGSALKGALTFQGLSANQRAAGRAFGPVANKKLRLVSRKPGLWPPIFHPRLPRIDDHDACSGEVFDVTSHDGEAVLKCGGGD
jgi:hypothetical protein